MVESGSIDPILPRRSQGGRIIPTDDIKIPADDADNTYRLVGGSGLYIAGSSGISLSQLPDRSEIGDRFVGSDSFDRPIGHTLSIAIVTLSISTVHTSRLILTFSYLLFKQIIIIIWTRLEFMAA